MTEEVARATVQQLLNIQAPTSEIKRNIGKLAKGYQSD